MGISHSRPYQPPSLGENPQDSRSHWVASAHLNPNKVAMYNDHSQPHVAVSSFAAAVSGNTSHAARRAPLNASSTAAGRRPALVHRIRLGRRPAGRRIRLVERNRPEEDPKMRRLHRLAGRRSPLKKVSQDSQIVVCGNCGIPRPPPPPYPGHKCQQVPL
jgi:hypothetical protein